jgi:hypothetical protein
VLTGSTKSPKDPHAVAKNCYLAFVLFPPSLFPLAPSKMLTCSSRRSAAVYGAFIAFCVCQVRRRALFFDLRSD